MSKHSSQIFLISMALSSFACGSSSPQHPANAAGGDTQSPVGAAGANASGGESTASAGTSAAAGGSSAAAGGSAPIQLPPHTVTACAAEGSPVGVWENVGPANVGEVAAFELDPTNPANIWLTSAGWGLFKSEDCGATWARIDDPASGIDKTSAGGPWTFVVDFVNPKVLYMNTGYGATGIFKSVDGGHVWNQLLPPDILKVFVFGGFVERIAMDPTNNLHLTAIPHFSCDPPHTQNCMIETFDAGATWTVLENTPGSGEGVGQYMIDSKNWMWGIYGGYFRTTNGGQSWEKVSDRGLADGLAHVKQKKMVDGKEVEVSTWFAPAISGVEMSTDTKTWTQVGWRSDAVVHGDGIIYASFANSNGGPTFNPYSYASVDAPTEWKLMDNSDNFSHGGWQLRYDSDHHILYSTNGNNGFFRRRVK
jgi:hypothetical protein